MNFSRRGLFKTLAALGAAPVLDRIAAMLPASAAERIGLIEPVDMRELAVITRKAFAPSIYVQIYQTHPLLKALL